MWVTGREQALADKTHNTGVKQMDFRPGGVFNSGLAAIVCSILLLTNMAHSSESTPLRTPAEFTKIMEDSKLGYKIINEFKPAPPVEPIVLSNQLHLVETDEGHSIEFFTLSEDATRLLVTAETAFNGGEYEKAVSLYNEILEIQPEYTPAVTLIGDVYYQLGTLDSCITYFQKAIDRNFIDYNAHWFLSDTYERLGRLDQAVEEATIAHLLNVNHTFLQENIRRIRAKQNRPWKEWSFIPQYSLAFEEGEVRINLTIEWLGYAMAKAVWEYEPGYSDSLLTEERKTQIVCWPEEKEAIAGYCATNPESIVCSEVILAGYFQEFVLYEMVEKNHPSVLALLPRDAFMKVVQYVDTYH